MTTVYMDWNRLKLTMDGHAGAGEKGNDLVCAAESMLVQALAQSLENSRQRGRTTARWKMEDGHAEVTANPGMGSMAEVKAYFRFCVTGMRMLAKEYPRNIVVREVG